MNPTAIPVPRDLVNAICPEVQGQSVQVEDLGPGRKLGVLDHVLDEEVGHYESLLQEKGYHTHTISPAGDESLIAYFRGLDRNMTEAMDLLVRDNALAEPPLSLDEHLKLANLMGVPEHVMEEFSQAVLTGLRTMHGEVGPTAKIVSPPVVLLNSPNGFGQL